MKLILQIVAGILIAALITFSIRAAYLNYQANLLAKELERIMHVNKIRSEERRLIFDQQQHTKLETDRKKKNATRAPNPVKTIEWTKNIQAPTGAARSSRTKEENLAIIQKLIK